MPANTVTCPSCNTTLKPKTPVAGGTRIKCPKCATVFAVPDDEAAAPAAAPRAAARSEESEGLAGIPGPGDDAGASGGGPAKKKGVPLWVWLTGGGVGLLVVCCGGCGVTALFLPNLMGLKTGGESASVSMANFDKIKKDMTEDQVKAIMGEPTASAGMMGVKAASWKKGDDMITVNYEKDKVSQKTCQIGGVTKSGF